MDFESVLQPIPEYIRWVTEKGELHYLTLEKTTHLIRENCEIGSSNDLFWPWRILDTFFNIGPEPLEEMLKQLSILSWLSVESAHKYLNAHKRKFEKSFRENMERETWRKHLLYKLCGWTEKKNAKLITALHIVAITRQSMFMVAGENSMEDLKTQHQALKTALVVTL